MYKILSAQVSRIFSLAMAYTEQAEESTSHRNACMPKRKGETSTIKTVIYLDVLLLVNFLAAYFLLRATGFLSGQLAGFSRLICASGIAALSALILFAPELSYPAQVLYKVLTACAVVGTAFGLQDIRHFITAVCWYTALNILLAGLCIMIILHTGTPLLQTSNLTVYLHISPFVLLLLSAISCGIIWLFLHFTGSPPQTIHTIGVEFELCSNTVRLRAMLDTGCHLKDPITCLPVLLISWPAAKGRLPEEINTFLGEWFRGMHPDTPPCNVNLRLIPCSTAAQSTLLPGFAVADIRMITETGTKDLGRTAIAFCSQPFQSAAYEALYGTDFL